MVCVVCVTVWILQCVDVFKIVCSWLVCVTQLTQLLQEYQLTPPDGPLESTPFPKPVAHPYQIDFGVYVGNFIKNATKETARAVQITQTSPSALPQVPILVQVPVSEEESLEQVYRTKPYIEVIQHYVVHRMHWRTECSVKGCVRSLAENHRNSGRRQRRSQIETENIAGILLHTYTTHSLSISLWYTPHRTFQLGSPREVAKWVRRVGSGSWRRAQKAHFEHCFAHHPEHGAWCGSVGVLHADQRRTNSM